MFNPYLAVVLTTIIWGSAGIFIKYLNLPPTTIAFFRTFVPAILLFFYFKFKKISIFKHDVKLIFLVSSMAILEFFFYFNAYNHTSITNSLITLYTWPIFMVISSAFFLKEKIPKINLLLLFTAFIGVIFVYGGNSFSLSDRDFVGVTSMLIASVFVASRITILKKLSKNHSNLELVFYHNFIGAIVFIPFLFFSQNFPTATQSVIAITYALLIGLLAYIPYYFALKHIKASVISLLAYIEVVSGVLFGVVLLHETLKWNLIIGGILIIGSALLIKK